MPTGTTGGSFILEFKKIMVDLEEEVQTYDIGRGATIGQEVQRYETM